MSFYIKYATTDVPVAPTGITRPVPPGSQPWLSPSVWIEGPGGSKLNQVTEDQPAELRVRVDNAAVNAPGPPPSDITVQVWVSDFTIGVGPAGHRATMSIPVEGLEDSPLDALPPTARLAKFTWTPLQGDMFNLDASGNAHMCIGANAFLDGVEGSRLLSGGLDIWNNQHHAQLNISILDAGDGSAMVAMVVNNTEEEQAVFRIEAHRARGRLGLIDREHLLALPHVRRVGGKPFDPKKLKGRELGEPLERIELRRGGKLVVGRDKLELHRARRGLKQIALEGPDGRGGPWLELELPRHDPKRDPTVIRTHLRLADPGDFGAVEIVDLVQRRADGEPVGGARILMVNAPARDRRA